MSRPLAWRRQGDRYGPWLFGLLALVPLWVYRDDFRSLFWFGDDWDQLDQIARFGFWSWTWQAFAENFVPLFKMAWGGLALAAHGSYFAMILAIWLTHALNVALLGKLLRQEGFGWTSTALSLAGFGLSSACIEILAWSVQWSAVMSMSFFLLAALWYGRAPAETSPNQRFLWILAALVAASALTFSRGVLTGLSLAFSALLLAPAARPTVARAKLAVCCFLPAAGVAGLIFALSSGNQHELVRGSHLGEMAQFGAWYFSLNPLYRLLATDSWGSRTTLLLGALRVALMLWVFWRATSRQRRFLGLLLAFGLGDSVLLGIGRYHTGLECTISSRYHYNALLCTLPFAGLAVESALGSVLAWFTRIRRTVAAVLVAMAALWVCRDWRQYAHDYGDSRGRHTRDLIFHQARPPDQGAIPGIPFLSTTRARDLTAIYHLH